MTQVANLPELERELLLAAAFLARRSLNELGKLRPFTITSAGSTRIISELEDDVPWDGSNPLVEESKTWFARLAKATVLATDADALVYAAEAWSIYITDSESAERYKSWRRANPEASFEEYEGRSEIVILWVESEVGRVGTQLELKRPANSPPTIDELTDNAEVSFITRDSPEWANTSGRFINLYVPKSKRTPGVVSLAKMFLELSNKEFINARDIS